MNAIREIVAGAIVLLLGLMYVLGADSIDVVRSIVSRIVSAIGGDATLGAIDQVKTTITTTMVLGIILIAAGGALMLWGLFQVIGDTPMGRYWQ